MNNDHINIQCHVLLVAADALTPDQLQRKREGKNSLEPLSEKTIEEILDAWRKKLRREIPKRKGYFVMGYTS